MMLLFDKEVESLTGGTITMGTEQYLLDREKKRGIQEGKKQGEYKKALAVALEFKKMGLPIADIAKGTGLSIEEIEKL